MKAKASPSWSKRFEEAVLRVALVALSAVTWFWTMAVAGAALLVRGVYMLAGPGWSLIAAGVLCLMVAVLILRGISHA